MGKELKFPLPHMLEDEFQLFSETVKPAKRYFEFGSGGSTTYVAMNTDAIIYSVDSQKGWLDKIAKYVGPRDNITYKYVDIGPLGGWGRPKDESKKHLWPNYSDTLQDSGFKPDLVLVDGRFRTACIFKTIIYSADNDIHPKIILHDCKRKEYHVTYEYLNKIKQTSRLCVFEIKEGVNLKEINSLIPKYETLPG
jgi:protein O-GlcNAc transferase